MFDEWRKLRRLRRELSEIDNEYAPQFRAAKTDDEYYPLRAEYDAVAGDTISQIEGIRTRKFKKKAAKFNIEIPGSSEEYWDRNFSGISYLTETAYAKFGRDIKEARFAYWERWAKLLVPILSLLIAIIALHSKIRRRTLPSMPAGNTLEEYCPNVYSTTTGRCGLTHHSETSYIA